MRISSLLPLMLFATGFVGAQGSPFSLNFQALQPGEQVLNYFNGGAGSLGSGPGPNFGITFTPDLQVQGTFTKQGFLTSSSSIMNVQAGFSGTFSFYASTDLPGATASIYSGLLGAGNLLDTISISSGNFQPSGDFINGTARSVVFKAPSDNLLGLATITNGAFVIPEPGSASLAGIGLLASAIAISLKQRPV